MHGAALLAKVNIRRKTFVLHILLPIPSPSPTVADWKFVDVSDAVGQ